MDVWMFQIVRYNARQREKSKIMKKTVVDNPPKRMIQRAIKKGVRHAARETMEVMGYNIIARKGWVIKVFKDGKRQNIKRIKVNSTKVVLD
jgi:transcriptional/translational regulatory protein YebC/TACO1